VRRALSVALFAALFVAPTGTPCGCHGTVARAQAAVGDDAGAVLAASCAGCHRDEPAPPRGIPSLAGLSAAEISEKLLAYRSGELEGTLMNRLALGYTDTQIRQLAAALGTSAE
jgi:cytochrome c553